MRCLRWLTRAVRGCPRQWQDVGGGAFLAGLLWAAMAWGQAYHIEDLGCFLPTALTNNREISGNSTYGAPTCGGGVDFPARLHHGTIERLANPEATGRAYAINTQGVTVGLSGAVPPMAYGPMVWDMAGVGTALPVPPGHRTMGGIGAGFCINEAGIIGGTVELDAGPTLPLRWRHGQVEVLATQGGHGWVHGCNANDHMVGRIWQTTGPFQAASWDTHGQLRLLGTLGGSDSEAFAINARGTIVGSSQDANNILRAFVWDSRRGMRALPGDHCYASAINNAGAIVGQCSINAQGQGGYAVLWMPPFYVAYNLNEAVDNGESWVLEAASGINDSGHISGEGTYNGVPGHGWLLVPSPTVQALWMSVAEQP